MVAMGLRHVCQEERPVSRANGRARMAKRNLWFLACAGAATFLLPVAHALRQQGGNGLRIKSPTQVGDTGEAVCSGEAQEYTATLSETNRKVSLQCAQTQTTVVPDLTKGWVCPTTTSNLAECKPANQLETKANNKAVSLSVLMGGTQDSPVNWVASPAVGAGEGKKYELSLPDAPLPLLDSTFFTGCKPDGEVSNNECKLTVTVEARKSAAAGQTVSCAYGAKSNEAKPTVTMTQQNNTVTLVCGNEAASVQPTDYTTDYCADDKVDAECKKEKFTSFIPGFQSAWWTENKTTRSVTLTIPREHFPDSPKTIHLGCLYTPPTTASEAKAAEATNTKKTCKVDVVISAKESSATGRTVAALPGLTVGAVVLTTSFLMWV